MEAVKARRIILIRHAESQYNKWRRESFTKLRLFDMVTRDPEMADPGLTEEAAAQIEGAREAVARLVPDNAVFFSSPLTRAIETARQLFKGRWPHLTVHVTPLLTEWVDTTGDTGLPLAELERRYNVDAAAANEENENVPPSGKQVTSASSATRDENSKLLSASPRAMSHTDVRLSFELWHKYKWPGDVWWELTGKRQLSALQAVYRRTAPEPEASVDERIRQLKALLRCEDRCAADRSRPIVLLGHAWFFGRLVGCARSKLPHCRPAEFVVDWEKFLQDGATLEEARMSLPA